MAQGSSNPTTDIKKVAGTAVDTNTGNASAGTQRVVLASNQPVIPVSDNGGSITVDGTFWQATQPVSLASLPTLPAGTNNIGDVDVASLPGTVAADITAIKTAVETIDNAISGSEMQVDVVSSALPTGAATSANQSTMITALQLLDDAVGTDGAAVAAGMLRVGGTDGTNNQTLSVNTSGHVNIADGGNSITVDGTVASTQSGTWTVQPGNTANTTPWLVKPAESLGTATALGALNAEIVQALNGNLGVGSTITATSAPTGITLTPYVSYDGGTNWTVTQFFNVTSALALSTIATFVAGDSYAISAGDGATHVKVRATAWTSGSVTVRLSASNSQGLVNLKSTAVHDDVAGTYTQLVGAVGSSTAPAAVSANGDAVRLWATTSGALNVSDGGGSITVDGTFWPTTQPVSGTVTANAGTGNFTVTQATAANLNATVTGTVELGATSLAALENISVTVPGTVDLGTVSLTALETITVTSGTPNNFQSKAYGAVTTAAPAYTNATDNALSLTTSGSLRTAVSEALPAGTNAIGKLAANSGVDIGDVDVLSVIPGTGATNLGKAVDSASAATDTGVASLAIRTDTLATLTPAVSDYTQLRVNSVGRLWASATIDAALPAGTNAIGKLAANDGVDIGDVTINNASLAVTGTFWQATQPVSLASVPSHPVTNAGTFAVQVTSAPTTAVTGTFWQATQPVSGTVTINAIPTGTNSIGNIGTVSTVTNLSQLGGAAISMGTGVRGAGVQRVTIATDDVVPASQSGTWNIGTVTTVSAVTAITNALPAGNNNIGDVDVASIVPGTAATNLGKAVDSAAGATDVGVAALVLRDDALAAISPTDGDYTRLRVNSTGRLWATTDIEGAVANAANSSTTVLAAAAVFTGTSVDVSAYAQIRVNVFASHASATNGLSMQFSPDGTNWDHTSTFTVPAANDISYLLPVTHKFFRIVYTNGATLQTAFRLTTALITNATTGTVKELSSSIDRSDFALSARAVMAGPATPGTTIALNEVTVKSASTAAATTDTALVTQLAPTVGTLGSVSVKTAITEPAFGTDVALTVQTRDPVRIRPSETYRDPVDKMRVSMGQSLIDTDFEYGIQPTKWESLTLLNNRATAFYDVTQVAPGTIGTTAVTISAITASSKTITITGTNLNAAGVFSIGQPIFVTGTLDTANADGWWIVDTVSATTLTFLVNNAPAATLYDATKTYIYPGTFFTGSSIALPSNSAIAATVATADTVGNFTCGATATLAVGNPVYVTGTNSGTGSITGYATGSVYYIIATNGSTTFQLSATPGGGGVTTVAGSLTGLTFSMNAITVTGTTVIVRTLNDHGLRVNNGIYMKGASGVTGGPVNGTWNIATTPLNNVFTYVTNTVATGAIIPQGGVNSTLYPRQPGYIEHRPYDGGVQFSNETAYHGYSDIRQTRRYFRYQSGKGIQFSTGTIMKPPFYVDSLTASGTTVTVTTKYPHGLLTGSTLIVSGASPAAYNGTFTVTGSTPLTITYTAGSAPGTSPATGFPITVSPGTWYGGSNRVGMFDQQNGFFFEFDGQTLYAVIRKSTDQISGKVGVTLGSQVVTGTNTFFSSQLKPGDQVVIRGMAYLVQNIQSNTSMTVYPEYRGVTTSNCICTKTVEIRTSQSGWNIDTVNSGTRSATNPNGFLLDLTKMQMFYADYSWYGAGAVRFGFKDQRGEVIFCHRVVNSNVNYEAYMRSGNLPARYETNTLPARTFLTATLAAATTTGGTITVDATTLFPSSGTVILTQSKATGAYSEYITYIAKTATTFTILARAQTGGVGTAQTFTYSATAPIKVEMYAPQAAQTLSHWGSSVIMDGGYDDDKSLVFNTGMTTPMITATAGTRYPLMSLRLAPTVDNGITGLLGAREIINRMQLALRSIGTYTTTVAFRIEILLNARVSGGTFAPVGGSSLSQICYHTNTQTVSGGESMFAFYATANDTNSMDLEQVRDLGTSILGGGTTLSFPTGNNEKYPDGPDIVTVIAIPLTANANSSIVARLNWTEAQA